MHNILILGAGSVAQTLIPLLLQNSATRLTLFARRPAQLKQWREHPQVRIIEGDVLDAPALAAAMQGQEAVYAGLSGQLEAMAAAVIAAMQSAAVKRLIWISSMGIYGETGEDHGAVLEPYRRSAALIEQSALDYTILRPAWFTNGGAGEYILTAKGEPFRGTRISRHSLAGFISQLLLDPQAHIRSSLGIADA